MGVYGAVREFSIDGRVFKVANDGPGSKDIGGKNNESQMNGDGTFRVIQTTVPGSFTGIQLEVDSTRGDHEFLQEIADKGLPVPVIRTTADGTSYTGDLVISGQIQADETSGTATLDFMGGKLTKL